jgi:hypothetical protein
MLGWMSVEPLARLRHFVRDTLGCGCPDEVLAAITAEEMAGPPLPRWRLDVGGRLLVWVVDGDRAAADAVAECLRAGVEERDRLGFNRFRLVVVGSEARATGSLAGDDRAHLHLIARDLLPPPLR